MLAAAFLTAGNAPPSAAEVAVAVSLVKQPPLIDGHALDESWREMEWTPLPDPELPPDQRLTVKACTDGLRLFLLVRFPAARELRRHRPWRWDPTAQHYVASDENEQSLTLLLLGAAGTADVWIWRADRTDAAGYADDGGFTPASGFLPDGGTACWKSRYFSGFAGAELPRFYPGEPTGSLADVRARGIWENGIWTVELSRPLDTKHPDDLPLLPGEEVRAQLFTGLPAAVPMPGRPGLRWRLPPAPTGAAP